MSAIEKFIEYADGLRSQVDDEFTINRREREQSQQEFDQLVQAVREEVRDS